MDRLVAIDDFSYSHKNDFSLHSLVTRDFNVLRVLGQGSFGKVLLVCKRSGPDKGTLFAMKVLCKSSLNERDRIRAKNERDLLAALDHPFIVHLNYAFQTETKIYLILEYICGGDLFSRLSREVTLSENDVKFYLAELILALDHLHQLGIIYRDLKPENILLDAEGHIKLTDFGLSKETELSKNGGRTFSFCGTIEYMAPEVINRRGHDLTADWWSMGVLMFEMLCGILPFRGESRRDTMNLILRAKLRMPSFLSEGAQSLLRGLFKRNPSHRLGHGQDSLSQFKKHEFFDTIYWERLFKKSCRSPYKPKSSELIKQGFTETRWSSNSSILSSDSASLENFSGFSFAGYFSPKSPIPEPEDTHRSLLESPEPVQNKEAKLNVDLTEIEKEKRPEHLILTPNASMKPPSFFNFYELIKTFGDAQLTGWRECVHKSTNVIRSVKVIKKGLYDHDKEIALLQRFRHLENVASILEVYETPTEVYLVAAPMLGGHLLSGVLKSNGFGETTACAIAASLSRTLYQLHRNKVFGVDLNPIHILLTGSHEDPHNLRLSNFTYAIDQNERGSSISKRPSDIFSAPEVSKQNSINFSSDMWSLGALMFCMLTGQTAMPGFRFSNAVQVTEDLKKVLDSQRQTISEDARDLIIWLLQLHPEKRPSASDVLSHRWITRHNISPKRELKRVIKEIRGNNDSEARKHHERLRLAIGAKSPDASIMRAANQSPRICQLQAVL